MIKRTTLVALLLIVFYWTVARAQQQHRVVDMLANKIIQKYQQASCEQLSSKKSEPRSPKEEEAVQMLRNNPEIRTEFINKVAAPIANKMFECGMIP
jgi:predicted Holliday junction resolvase-like endonuclease